MGRNEEFIKIVKEYLDKYNDNIIFGELIHILLVDSGLISNGVINIPNNREGDILLSFIEILATNNKRYSSILYDINRYLIMIPLINYKVNRDLYPSRYDNDKGIKFILMGYEDYSPQPNEKINVINRGNGIFKKSYDKIYNQIRQRIYNNDYQINIYVIHNNIEHLIYEFYISRNNKKDDIIEAFKIFGNDIQEELKNYFDDVNVKVKLL